MIDLNKLDAWQLNKVISGCKYYIAEYERYYTSRLKELYKVAWNIDIDKKINDYKQLLIKTEEMRNG